MSFRPLPRTRKKTGKGMRGDVLEIMGLPLEFWSHCDILNAQFSTGVYEKQSVLLRGMDGHTAGANRALLQRAGITADFLKKLSAGERSYYGIDINKDKDDKDMQPNGFLVDAGTEKIEPLLPRPTPDRLLAAARAALQYNYSLGITAWLDPLAEDDVLRAYKLLADRGELTSQVVAFPQVFAKDPVAELAAVQRTREAYKNVPNLHVTGIKIFADGVVEYPSQTAHLSKPYKKTGAQRRSAVRSEEICRTMCSGGQAGINHSRARHWRRRRDRCAGRDCGGAPGQWQFRVAAYAYA